MSQKSLDALALILIMVTIALTFLVLNKFGYLDWMRTRRDPPAQKLKLNCTCETTK